MFPLKFGKPKNKFLIKLSFFNFFSERILRLQHENQMLKSHQNDATNNEQISLLQAQCEQLKDQNHQLTNDLWFDLH